MASAKSVKTETEPLIKSASGNPPSYSAIVRSQQRPTVTSEKGPLPEHGFATFLRIDGEDHGDLVPLHEVTAWDMHFMSPLFHSMLTVNDPCDGRDFGGNERNYLAWLRLAAGFTSTSYAFILNYYIPPGSSIFGPDKTPIEPTLQNRGALGWGLVFLVCSIGTILYAFQCYLVHNLHFGRRRLLVQFSWDILMFFGLTCLATVAASFYMMAGGLIERQRIQFW
ncbi:hypothetical protein BZA70DRAFT_267746 [Myxozyma melibiosi]|uniref:DUF202 domain-containing protein n=1 Tax=Myxozyma melibiosi TaxID=54550 RepID=A0ABR1F5U8_9ASCO